MIADPANGWRETSKRRLRHLSGDATPARLRPVLQAAVRFASAIEARTTVPMLSSGLTMTQLRAVKAIQHRGRANGRELATLLRLSPSAIVAISDHLERMDLVRRLPDTEDRRITWFVLTERGGELLRRVSPDLTAAKDVLTTRVARLSPCERDGFVKIATAFADAMGSLVGEQDDVRDDDLSRKGKAEVRGRHR